MKSWAEIRDYMQLSESDIAHSPHNDTETGDIFVTYELREGFTAKIFNSDVYVLFNCAQVTKSEKGNMSIKFADSGGRLLAVVMIDDHQLIDMTAVDVRVFQEV